MTDEQAPDPTSRRGRLASRRQRLRMLGLAFALVLVLAAVVVADTNLRGNDTGPTTSAGNHAAGALDPTTTLNLGKAAKLPPPRALSHDDPLALWIGGDSLAGSFGPALGQTAGATGVVKATIDYKVSSGLADDGIRDWEQHAQDKMASENPDAVVFIIGTNDASIVNSQDSNHDGVPDWEVSYREKIDRMMATFVGGPRKRTVFWLSPPTLGDPALDRGAKALGPVMREEAKKFSPDVVFVDTYSLFSGPNGGYARSLPDGKGHDVQMRISDGVHFTVDGAQYLANAVWKLLNSRWDIARQADASQPIDYTIAPGSNDYVPGLGHYRPPVTTHSPSSTTPRSSVTGTTRVGGPTTTPVSTRTTTPGSGPPTSTPGTTPVTTPPTPPPVTAPKPKPTTPKPRP